LPPEEVVPELLDEEELEDELELLELPEPLDELELEDEELPEEEDELLVPPDELELDEEDELLLAAKVTTALPLVTMPAELETTTV
jgi:hypothetical protein